jgi:hypothetical protein
MKNNIFFNIIKNNKQIECKEPVNENKCWPPNITDTNNYEILQKAIKTLNPHFNIPYTCSICAQLYFDKEIKSITIYECLKFRE